MRHRSVTARAVAVLLGLSGLALLVGGFWLAGLGGSWYYLLAGAALLFDAWWLRRGRRGALLLFAAIVAATLCWALRESGLDWWSLPLRMGVPNLGGPLATAGGVAFLSGTLDNFVRGYDVRTGEELWRVRLPAGGQATPMTYEGSDGRQDLLVAAGGHGSLGTRPGDDVIAYASRVALA